MKEYEYKHKVHYYETDRMGITHHSNYIRWMEEARVAFLDSIGCSYAKLEEMKVVSPVLKITCDYKHTTTFDDDVLIKVKVKSYNGLKLVVKYTMINMASGQISLEGESEHCFLNENGKIIRMKNEYPEFHNTLMTSMENEE